MDNLEGILQGLEKFEKKSCPDEIPESLEEYLQYIAKTGDPVFPWQRVKPLVRHKLVTVMSAFNGLFGGDDVDGGNLPFSYNPSRKKILDRFDTFTGAPFTIQRLCEILINPTRHYKKMDNFLRALEKNILVVSCVEPGRRKSTTSVEHGNLVNGLQEGNLTFTGSAMTNHSSSQSAHISGSVGSSPSEGSDESDPEEGAPAGIATTDAANEDSSSSSSSSSCSSSASSSPVPEEEPGDPSSSKRIHGEIEEEGEVNGSSKKPRWSSPQQSLPLEPLGEAQNSVVEGEEGEAKDTRDESWSSEGEEAEEEVGVTHRSTEQASKGVSSSADSTVWNERIQEGPSEDSDGEKSNTIPTEGCQSNVDTPSDLWAENDSNSVGTTAVLAGHLVQQHCQKEQEATDKAVSDPAEAVLIPAADESDSSTHSGGSQKDNTFTTAKPFLVPPESSSPPHLPPSPDTRELSPESHDIPRTPTTSHQGELEQLESH